MAKKIGVVLSGCGVYDGAEIHESVITLLALDRQGAEVVMMAPDISQMHVINHLTGDVDEAQERNVLVESARIARGEIRNIAEVSADEIDGLILPGGFGAAKNLCDFAVKGADCAVNPATAALVKDVHAQGKPVAAVCIAPAVLAQVLGEKGPELTIGSDEGTASALESMGAKHISCAVDRFVVDRDKKVITSPAYMLGQRISEVAEGIERTVEELVKLA